MPKDINLPAIENRTKQVVCVKCNDEMLKDEDKDFAEALSVIHKVCISNKRKVEKCALTMLIIFFIGSTVIA